MDRTRLQDLEAIGAFQQGIRTIFSPEEVPALFYCTKRNLIVLNRGDPYNTMGELTFRNHVPSQQLELSSFRGPCQNPGTDFGRVT